MSESLGGIYYDVDLETAQLISKSRQVNGLLDDLGDAAKGASAGVGKLETSVTATAGAVSQATGGLKNMRMVFGQLGYQIQDVAVQLQMGQNAMMVFAQQGSQIASIFGPGRAIAGAVIAITGALAGALLPSLFNSKDATDDLEKAQKALAETITETDTGVLALSEKIQRLAAVSADAAKAQIAVSMADAQKAISSASVAVSEQVNELGSWKNSMSAAESQLARIEAKGLDASKVLKTLGGTYEGNIAEINALNAVTGSMSEELGVTQTQAIGLVKVFGEFRKNQTPENMKLVAQALASVSDQAGWVNPKLNELTRVANSNSLSAGNASSALDVLKSALNNLTGSIDQSKEALSGHAQQLERLVDAAKNEAATVGMSARQRALYVAGLLKADSAEKDAINTSYDKIEAYQEEQKALKEKEQADKKAASEAESAAKKEAAAQQAVVNQLDNLSDRYQVAVLEQQGMGRQAAVLAAQQQLGAAATAQQVQQAGNLAGKLYDVAQATKAAKEEEQKRKEANQNFTQLQNQASPVASVDNTFQQQMAQLDQYAAYYPQKIAQVEAVRASIEDQYRQKRQAAMWEEWAQQNEANQLLASSIDSLQGGATNAITGLLNGTQSLSEAFANIGSTILNSVVSSLVQMGLEWVKSQMMGQAAQTAATASNQATATAALAASTAAGMASAATLLASWSPAAMAASIATSGGAATAGLAGYTTAMTTAQTMAIAGMRKNGGPVSAGSVYQVGESGLPEIYQASTGKQYMIPGDNGKVISNKDLQGSGGGVTSLNQVMNLTVNTTNGLDDATIKQLRQAWKSDTLYIIKDQQRPRGLLNKG